MTVLGGVILVAMCAVVVFSMGWALGWYSEKDDNNEDV